MPVNTGPIKGNKTTLAYKKAGTLVYMLVAKSIKSGGVKVTKIDTTTLQSDNMTSLPGMPEYDDYSATIQFMPTAAIVADIRNMIEHGLVSTWQVQSPDGSVVAPDNTNTGSTESFDGYISGFTPTEYALNGLVTADISIAVSGPVTFVPAS